MHGSSSRSLCPAAHREAPRLGQSFGLFDGNTALVVSHFRLATLFFPSCVFSLYKSSTVFAFRCGSCCLVSGVCWVVQEARAPGFTACCCDASPANRRHIPERSQLLQPFQPGAMVFQEMRA